MPYECLVIPRGTMVMTENREYKFARKDIVTLLCEVAAQYARRNGPPLNVLIYGGTAVKGLDITREEAEAYLAEMDDMELDSDQLKNVAGGACWHGES